MTSTGNGWTRGHSGWAFGTALMFTLGIIFGMIWGNVLLGLVLNSAFGWWWADAVAGLVIAAFAVREGVEAWRGDACATSVGVVLENER